MRIIPRAEWGARAPKERSFRTWSQVTDFTPHYSGASENQTPRSIQAYHMDTRGWSDIGYNFLINKRGEIFEGRGFLVVGAHVANHNTPTMGVCFIGDTPDDLTPAAKLAGIWLRAECDRRKRLALGSRARSLLVKVHGDYSGASTDCPGSAIRAWTRAGMPVPTGTTPTPPAPPAANWTETLLNTLPTLSLGAEGRDVVRLQSLVNVVLRAIGRPELKEDGDFGAITDRDLRIVQRHLRLVDDGDAGRLTWTALLTW